MHEYEDLRSRPDFDGLQYQGQDSGILVLPHFSLSWQELSRLAGMSGKPLADLGASCSSLSAEAELQGLQMIPIDIMERIRGGEERYRRVVQSTFDTFGTALGIPSGKVEFIREAIEISLARYCHADIAQLPFPDRYFSVCLAHDSVPKHSATVERFLSSQLPEMMRVTDSHLYVYPFALYETSNEGELEPVHELFLDSTALEKVQQIAWQQGFSFELIDSGPSLSSNSPNQTALFRRLLSIDLQVEQL